NGRGSRAEVVVDRIIEEQKIEVDAVSGATNSSTVIKKAVENALTGEK
ncbi:MAG: FMN-binding protein, partial [Lachnospiraceae bacterium]|nr:FMN-binding protein [Lachnospiraceae bacterium]